MNLKKKSLEVLKSLQLKNGGIIATPKSGAYPYIYPRDAVMMTVALNSAGLHRESEKFYYFMRKFAKLKSYGEIFQRYNCNGLPCVTRKNENDNEGLVLYGIYEVYKHSKNETFIQNMWAFIEEIVGCIFSYFRQGLVKTEEGLHEFYALEHGYDLWVNCACWRGLSDAAKIAKILGHEEQSKIWLKKANELKKNIFKKFYEKKKGFYIKNPINPNSPDISQLAPFYFEMDNIKKRLRKTMDYLKKHIWDEDIGGFKRFRKFEICKDWHWYTGGSGSWCVLTAWGARFYKELGNEKMYKKCVKWLEKIAFENKGLLPEHIARKEEYDEWKAHEIEFNLRIINEMKEIEKKVKKSGNKKIIYWAVPLGWSHAEYLLLKNRHKMKR